MKTKAEILNKPHNFGESWRHNGNNLNFKTVFMKPHTKYDCIIVAYINCTYGKYYGLLFNIYEIKNIVKQFGHLKSMEIEIYNIPSKQWVKLRNNNEKDLLAILNSSGYDKTFYGCIGNVDYLKAIETRLKRDYDSNHKISEKYEFEWGTKHCNYQYRDGEIVINKHNFKASKNRLNINDLIKRIKKYNEEMKQ
nr:hypothetical protein [Methanobrevibacter arboriphilus]